jgi:hypothetical protein
LPKQHTSRRQVFRVFSVASGISLVGWNAGTLIALELSPAYKGRADFHSIHGKVVRIVPLPTSTLSPKASRAASNREGHPSGHKSARLLDAKMKRHLFRCDAQLEVLHTALELFGYLNPDLLIYGERY